MTFRGWPSTGPIYGSDLSNLKPRPLALSTKTWVAPWTDSADDVGPDAPLPAPARGRDPSFAVVDLLDLFAWARDSHRLRLARLATETSRPTGRAQDAGARNFLAPSFAPSLDLRRPRLLRHWANDFGRDPRLGRRLDLMDQRRRRRAFDIRGLAPRHVGALPIGRSTLYARSRSFWLTNLASSSTTRSSIAFRRFGSCTRHTTRPKC